MRAHFHISSTPITCTLFALFAASSACTTSSDDSMVTPTDSGVADTGSVARPCEILSFASDTSSVAPGTEVLLSWTVRGADEVTIVANPGDQLGAPSFLQMSSRRSPPLTQTTEFTLTAAGPNCDGVTAAVTVNVLAEGTPPRIVSFSARPNPVIQGMMTTFSWSTMGADELGLVAPDGSQIVNLGAGMQAQIDSGQAQAQINANGIYTLTATNASGSVTATIAMTTTPPPRVPTMAPSVNSFTATPLAIDAPTGVVELRWDVSDTDDDFVETFGIAANGTDLMIPFAAVGTATVSIDRTTTFSLVIGNRVQSNIIAQVLVHKTFEVEPNDGFMDATEILSQSITSSMGGQISPADEDWYFLDVPAGGFISATTHGDGAPCGVDTELDLFDSTGTFRLGGDDDDGVGSCSALRPNVDEFARELAGGRYYLRVTSSTVGGYRLTAFAGEGGCGNGVPETGEQCDDGNLLDGDGCSSICELPNNGTLMGPMAGNTAAVSNTFNGVVMAPATEAVFIVTLVEPGYITAESAAPLFPQCNTDTLLSLEEVSTQNLLASNDNGPTNAPCSLLETGVLLPGLYRVILRAVGNLTQYAVRIDVDTVRCGNGRVEASEGCDDGNLTPGDGCDAMCVFEGPMEMPPNQSLNDATLITIPNIAQGSLQPADIFDWYAFDVPNGHNLEAFVTANSLSECILQGEVITLQLYGGPDRLLLAESTGPTEPDDCARLSAQTNDFLRNMPGGRYYLRINDVLGRPVNTYYLHVSSAANFCGDGLHDVGEQCDDGMANSAAGCMPGACTVTTSPMTISGLGGQVTLTIPANGRAAVPVTVTGGQSLTVTTEDVGATCMGFTVVDLVSPTTRLLGTIDISGCSSINPPGDTFATDLAAGTYLVVVQNRAPTQRQIIVDVTIADPRCGDMLTQRNAPAPEQCDPGMMTAPGCTAMCQLDNTFILESEDNGSVAMADDTGLRGSGVQLLSGALQSTTDEDFYRFEITAPTSNVNISVYGDLADRSVCPPPSGAPFLQVLDANLNQVGMLGAPVQGVCVEFDMMNVPTGVYYVRVRPGSLQPAVPIYFMNVEIF